MAGRGFRVTIEGLEELGADMSRLAHPGLRDAIRESLRGAGGEAIAAEMRIRTPRRSGRTVGGIKVHGDASRGDDVLVGYNDGPIGKWIESGTKPHEIRARDGGSLMFNGMQVDKVDHPGTRGKRVASKSMKAAEWEVMADIVDKINAKIGGNES